ncbi:MAG: hypothetical protein M3024_03625, partial [Candidatus Dormibacteraeota bacterium]|nr:hypothetical protein [Candidatus Dormibacteraeota bacterium]
MAERTLTGFAAAPGLAAGPVVLLAANGAGEPVTVPTRARRSHRERALRALEAAAVGLERIGSELRQDGRTPEAEIVETEALMARDPGLEATVTRLILEGGRTAGAALHEATEAVAEQLVALPDPMLAERADDVRSLGRRAAKIAAGTRSTRARGGVLVAPA